MRPSGRIALLFARARANDGSGISGRWVCLSYGVVRGARAIRSRGHVRCYAHQWEVTDEHREMGSVS